MFYCYQNFILKIKHSLLSEEKLEGQKIWKEENENEGREIQASQIQKHSRRR